MVAVIGFLVAWIVVTGIVWWRSGLTFETTPDPTFAPADFGSRLASTTGGLAGFAVTGVVLLVSQTTNLAQTGDDLTAVLAMFVVAYMGLLATAFQFANVAPRTPGPFSLGDAQAAGATISLYYVFIGWFALRPLFQAFELTAMADITSWLLIAANLFGYPILGTILYRTGYATFRTVLLLPALAVLAAVVYVLGVRWLVPGGRAPDGTLVLTLLAFVPGAAMYAILSALPMLAGQQRLMPFLTRHWHLVVLSYTAAVMVAVEMLLVSVLGFA